MRWKMLVLLFFVSISYVLGQSTWSYAPLGIQVYERAGSAVVPLLELESRIPFRIAGPASEGYLPIEIRGIGTSRDVVIAATDSSGLLPYTTVDTGDFEGPDGVLSANRYGAPRIVRRPRFGDPRWLPADVEHAMEVLTRYLESENQDQLGVTPALPHSNEDIPLTRLREFRSILEESIGSEVER
jgi:hypothetical protein